MLLRAFEPGRGQVWIVLARLGEDCLALILRPPYTLLPYSWCFPPLRAVPLPSRTHQTSGTPRDCAGGRRRCSPPSVPAVPGTDRSSVGPVTGCSTRRCRHEAVSSHAFQSIREP